LKKEGKGYFKKIIKRRKIAIIMTLQIAKSPPSFKGKGLEGE